jgi:hypothetical protein
VIYVKARAGERRWREIKARRRRDRAVVAEDMAIALLKSCMLYVDKSR